MATWKEIAFVGDVATLSSAAPSAIGSVASAGVGTSASRSDHVHILGTAIVGSENLKTLTANMNFGGYQATEMSIMQSANPPTTPKVGMIYQDSDDGKLYICTSAP